MQSVKIGDIILKDNLYYEITSVEPLYYEYEVTTSTVTPGGTANVTIDNLTPGSSEAYIIEKVGISGAISIMVQVPPGQPIGTPKGERIYLDELMASKYQPADVEVILLTSDKIGLGISAPSTWNGNASVWFYGVKAKVRQISAAEATNIKLKADARGIQIVEAEAPKLLIEPGPRPAIFVYDPISQRFVPKAELSGVPQQGFASSVGSTTTTVLPVPSGSAFALTDITITPHYTYQIQTANASGIATSPGTAVGLSGPLDLLNLTIYNSTTVAVTVAFTDGSGGGIIYQNSIAAGAYVNVSFSQPIPIANQVYAYASTSGVVNVSVTERYPSAHISQVIAIYDGTTQVDSLSAKVGKPFTKSYRTPIVFRTAVQASVSFGTADIQVSGLIVV